MNIKKDFPLLNSSDVIFLDNASTTQKPQVVIDAVTNFYTNQYANIHRGIYELSEHATEQFEQVRKEVADFIGAERSEIVFTQGTTHGINFIATAWARATLTKGDEIVLTEMEHHSNLIPWQQIAQITGALLKFIPVSPEGTLDLSHLDSIITARTKLVTVVHVSNALGTHNDIETIRTRARSVGAKILLDAAQSVAHQALAVKKLDVDFLVFSGHKLLAPTGIGVLYINKKVQPEIPPYQFGGGMIFHAEYQQATWRKPPHCYEAGTPPIAQVIGLGAALSYIKKNINFTELQNHEASLCTYFINELHALPEIRLLGPLEQLKNKGHLISFTIQGWHPHDIGAYLDQHAIAVRTGHYCVQPLAHTLGIQEGSIRISFYAYTSLHDVERCVELLKTIVKK